MLPVRGKPRQHCCASRGHNKCFWRFSETFFVSRTQNLCRTQMLRAWENEATFGKHDHVSNVAGRHNVSSFCRPLMHAKARLRPSILWFYSVGSACFMLSLLPVANLKKKHDLIRPRWYNILPHLILLDKLHIAPGVILLLCLPRGSLPPLHQALSFSCVYHEVRFLRFLRFLFIRLLFFAVVAVTYSTASLA